jgi:hypothetical protein
MDPDTTRGLINQILYGIDFLPDLSDEAVGARADSLFSQRCYSHPVAEYAQAIELTLQTGRLSPQTIELNRRYTETELLDFLARLAKRLAEKLP